MEEAANCLLLLPLKSIYGAELLVLVLIPIGASRRKTAGITRTPKEVYILILTVTILNN